MDAYHLLLLAFLTGVQIRSSVLTEISSSNCGIRTAFGEDAAKRYWPWSALLYLSSIYKTKKQEYRCAGTLIGEQEVLTAADCVYLDKVRQRPDSMTVVLGQYKLLVTEGKEQIYRVTKIDVHDRFDLAIIHLDKSVQYTDYVRPVCLWSQDIRLSSMFNQTGSLAAWGENQMEDTWSLEFTPVVNSTQCFGSHKNFYPHLIIDESTFCIETEESRTFTERGVGLYFPNPLDRNKWELRAVRLSSSKRFSFHIYIFTDIANSLDWIKERTFSSKSDDNNNRFSPTLFNKINLQKCGTTIVTTTGLISHGDITVKGQWPWHAALYRREHSKTNYKCGGTLISNQQVLTAAHCSTEGGTPLNPQDLVIVLGKYGLWTDGKNEQIYKVTKIDVYENFNSSTFYNDISILHLNRSIKYTEYVRPICLWSQDIRLDSVVHKTGTVVGWGRDHDQNSNTDILMMARMPVKSHLECLYSHRQFFALFINEENFCAGYSNGTSACNGDSGGGLVFPKPGTSGTDTVWEIRGIVSTGVSKSDGSCDPNYYVIFTDVAKYLDWIKNIIKS